MCGRSALNQMLLSAFVPVHLMCRGIQEIKCRNLDHPLELSGSPSVDATLGSAYVETSRLGREGRNLLPSVGQCHELDGDQLPTRCVVRVRENWLET